MNQIHPTAIIHTNVTLGEGNTIGAYCVIGGDGDIRGKKDFNGTVTIGNNNRFSEGVIIHRGTEGETYIGDNNFIMSGVYIAHNVEIGDDCEVCANSTIGGYAKIKSGAKLKMNCTIRNRKQVGNSVIGMGSVVVCDVPDGEIWLGNPAKPKPSQQHG